MKFEELKASLKREIKPTYLLYGSDTFLVYKSTELIKQATLGEFIDLNLKVFSEDDKFTISDVLNALSSVSFMGDKRLIILKNFNQKLSKAEESLLNNYLKNPIENSVLVFCYTASSENIKKLIANPSLEIVNCDFLSSNMLSKYIAKNFQDLGKTIAMDATFKLIELCGSDLFKISNEINKIAAYVGSQTNVSLADVSQNVTETLDFQIYELTEALGKKDNTKVIQIYNTLVSEKNTQGLFGLLYNYFSRMFFVAISADQSVTELAGKLFVKEYAIKMAIKSSQNYTKKQLKEILIYISDAEFDFKSGKLKEEAAFYNLLMRIML